MAIQADPILQRIGITGQTEVIAALDSMGKAGESAFTRLKKAIAGERELDRVTKGLTDIQREAIKADKAARDLGKTLQDDFKDIGKVFLGIAGAIATVVAGFVTLAKSAADASDKVRDSAIAVGTSTQTYQRLEHAFKLSGSSAAGFSKAMGFVNDAVGDAQKAGTASTGMWAKLGIRLTEGSGQARNAEAIMSDLADVFKRLPSDADRAALAVQLFGRRAGPEFVQVLAQGGDAIKALGDDAEALGIVLTDVQTKAGEELNDAFDRLTGAASALKTQFGLLFAPELTEQINRLANFIAANRQQILAYGEAIKNVVMPIIRDLISALVGEREKIESGFIRRAYDLFILIGSVVREVVIPAVNLFIETLRQALNLVNQIFGTDFTPGDVAMMVIFVALTVAVGKFVAGLLGLIRVLGLTRLAMIAVGATPMGRAIGLISAALLVAIGLIDTLTRKWKELRIAMGGKPDVGSGDTFGPGFKRGGAVFGPGTGTSDSIPAWLSHGEFVIPARAVRKYGFGLMEAIRTLRFADGGPVGMGATQRFQLPAIAAGQNREPAGGVLNLSIGGQQFNGLVAPKQTYEALLKFAVSSQVSSAGRKPGWVGG